MFPDVGISEIQTDDWKINIKVNVLSPFLAKFFISKLFCINCVKNIGQKSRLETIFENFPNGISDSDGMSFFDQNSDWSS